MPPFFVHFDEGKLINCTKSYCFFATFFVYLFYTMLLARYKGAERYDFKSNFTEYDRWT